jgi:hypothetical protein
MTIITKPLMAALAIACAGAVQAEAPAASPHAGQPHAGQQQRAIKALSAGDVAGLLAGSGAGFAKAAELNGYPGPLHVLELANELRLSDAQAESTRSLMARHKQEAARLGAALVEAERELDGLFGTRQATPEAVDRATARIGGLQAQLRAEHLKTHLAQTALLDAGQVHRYAALRGYGAAGTPDAPASHRGHSTHKH